MKALKISSVIVMVMMALRFIALLDVISFDFGFVSEIGKYVPGGWVLGLVGAVINVSLYDKAHNNRKWKIYSVTCSVFCAFTVLLELLMIYIMSQI